MNACPAPEPGASSHEARQNAMMLAKHGCPAGCGKWFLPLEVTVPAGIGGVATATNEPQRAFKAVRLFIPPAIAALVNVTDFRVANVSQFAAAGTISAQFFVSDSVDSMVCFSSTWGTNDYDLALINLTALPVVVNAAVLGYVKL